MKNPGQARDAAESSFKKKERRISEGRKAMAEHDAALRSVDANTARLRALRLARDAAEKLAPAKTAKVSAAKKKKIAPASPPVAAAIEPRGADKQQLLQAQKDHLEMAERDGARGPTTRTTAERMQSPLEQKSGS